MEWKLKQYHTCVDPALDIVVPLKDDPSQYPLHLQKDDWMLGYMVMVQEIREAAEELKQKFEAADEGEKVTNWELMSYSLRTMIQELKPQAREICFLLLGGGFICKYSCQLKMSSSYKYRVEIEDFMCSIQMILRGFSGAAPELAFIQEKLELFGAFIKVLNKWPYRYMSELICHIQTWASHISCLVYLYGEYDESLAFMETLISELMRKTLSCNPRSITLILDVFKSGKRHKFQGTILSQFLADYVKLLLRHVVKHYVMDDAEILGEGLTFLLSFAMDKPYEDSKETKLILAEVYQ
ncbi:OLC1v1006037C1 [Oldenlandia corymbosa var. corymbosa]|uniref:OLC1v1006037C1 n=1 Tax=Oldenlandia corymbosa var. corymbosa TaxID=529605 RepID=A0AAV1DG17_OLDCO|nr:OLC1v1006037C1 [Oldenlandia corymbosa var. corymbosa]